MRTIVIMLATLALLGVATTTTEAQRPGIKNRPKPKTPEWAKPTKLKPFKWKKLPKAEKSPRSHTKGADVYQLRMKHFAISDEFASKTTYTPIKDEHKKLINETIWASRDYLLDVLAEKIVMPPKTEPTLPHFWMARLIYAYKISLERPPTDYERAVIERAEAKVLYGAKLTKYYFKDRPVGTGRTDRQILARHLADVLRCFATDYYGATEKSKKKRAKRYKKFFENVYEYHIRIRQLKWMDIWDHRLQHGRVGAKHEPNFPGAFLATGQLLLAINRVEELGLQYSTESLERALSFYLDARHSLKVKAPKFFQQDAKRSGKKDQTKTKGESRKQNPTHVSAIGWAPQCFPRNRVRWPNGRIYEKDRFDMNTLNKSVLHNPSAGEIVSSFFALIDMLEKRKPKELSKKGKKWLAEAKSLRWSALAGRIALIDPARNIGKLALQPPAVQYLRSLSITGSRPQGVFQAEEAFLLKRDRFGATEWYPLTVKEFLSKRPKKGLSFGDVMDQESPESDPYQKFGNMIRDCANGLLAYCYQPIGVKGNGGKDGKKPITGGGKKEAKAGKETKDGASDAPKGSDTPKKPEAPKKPAPKKPDEKATKKD